MILLWILGISLHVYFTYIFIYNIYLSITLYTCYITLYIYNTYLYIYITSYTWYITLYQVKAQTHQLSTGAGCTPPAPPSSGCWGGHRPSFPCKWRRKRPRRIISKTIAASAWFWLAVFIQQLPRQAPGSWESCGDPLNAS